MHLSLVKRDHKLSAVESCSPVSNPLNATMSDLAGGNLKTPIAIKIRLFNRLERLGIAARPVPYPAHASVAEGKRLRGKMAGMFTKNLLLQDKKYRLFLVSIHEDRDVDLGRLHTKIGASGRLSFAPAARMLERLGVRPGALTPLSLINDIDVHVTAVIDSALLTADLINFHPLTNTESIGLAPADLLKFIRSCDRDALLLDLGAIEVGQ